MAKLWTEKPKKAEPVAPTDDWYGPRFYLDDDKEEIQLTGEITDEHVREFKKWSKFYFGTEDYKSILDVLAPYDATVRRFKWRLRKLGYLDNISEEDAFK